MIREIKKELLTKIELITLNDYLKVIEDSNYTTMKFCIINLLKKAGIEFCDYFTKDNLCYILGEYGGSPISTNTAKRNLDNLQKAFINFYQLKKI